MAKPDVKTSYESLRARVSAVAALHYRCAVAESGGRFVWVLGGALLAALLLDVYVALSEGFRGDDAQAIRNYFESPAGIQ